LSGSTSLPAWHVAGAPASSVLFLGPRPRACPNGARERAQVKPREAALRNGRVGTRTDRVDRRSSARPGRIPPVVLPAREESAGRDAWFAATPRTRAPGLAGRRGPPGNPDPSIDARYLRFKPVAARGRRVPWGGPGSSQTRPT
jgi:hypothetical protein